MSAFQLIAETAGQFSREVLRDPFRPKGKRFSYTRRWLQMNFRWVNRQPAIPSVLASAIVPDIESMVMPVDIRFGRWNVAPLELYYISCLARAARAQKIFEIGTYDGATTLQLARVCPEARIFTLDLPEVEDHFTVGARFVGQPEQAQITQLRGDSTRFDYSPYVGAMDFIFVDGDHSFQNARSDTATAFRLAKPDATIVWHDYLSFPGVKQVIDGLARQHSIVHVIGTELAVLRLGAAPVVSRPLQLGEERYVWSLGHSS